LTGSASERAVSLRQPVLALRVSPTEEGPLPPLLAAWGNRCRSSLIESPYRAVIPPPVTCIESLPAQRPDLTLTVILPGRAVRHWWQRPLHENTAVRRRHALAPLSKVIVTSVRFHV
jgi:hypothetical protein